MSPKEETTNKGNEEMQSVLRRRRAEKEVKERADKFPETTAGAIAKMGDMVMNPSDDKQREFTVIDRFQGRFLPQLDLIADMEAYVIEVAVYRQDKEEYKAQFEQERPIPPALLPIFIKRTAQWQKSIAGKNLEAGRDLTLAEIESSMEQPPPLGGEGVNE